MLAWLGDALRPTRDADLLGFGDLSDTALENIFADVCKMDVEPDAMVYLADTVCVEPIRAEDAYGGQRVTLDATLGAARLRVQMDVGIGDAVVPPAVWLDYPSLLDFPRPRLRAYAAETVIAEKFHAIVVLGLRNSRMKDYFDLYALSHRDAEHVSQVDAATAATFERRKTPLPDAWPLGLSDEFAHDAAKLARWQAFLAKNRLDAPTLAKVIDEVRQFLAEPLKLARQRQKAPAP